MVFLKRKENKDILFVVAAGLSTLACIFLLVFAFNVEKQIDLLGKKVVSLESDLNRTVDVLNKDIAADRNVLNVVSDLQDIFYANYNGDVEEREAINLIFRVLGDNNLFEK